MFGPHGIPRSTGAPSDVQILLGLESTALPVTGQGLVFAECQLVLENLFFEVYL